MVRKPGVSGETGVTLGCGGVFGAVVVGGAGASGGGGGGVEVDDAVGVADTGVGSGSVSSAAG